MSLTGIITPGNRGMAGLDERTDRQPQRESQIALQSNGLGAAINSNIELVDRLEKQLNGVLRDSQPEIPSPNKEIERESLVGLAAHLRALCDDVMQINRRLSGMLDRLEL